MMQAVLSETLRPLKRVEFDQLVAAGAFERERVELVRGVLVEMAPIGEPHNETVEVLNELMVLALAGRARVRVQMSFAASEDSEPQPDLLIVDKRVRRGADQPPSTAVLAIEVAESSLRLDRTVKAFLYAEAGIPEYWLFDVARRAVEVYSRPARGRYQKVTRHSGDDVLRPRAFPDVEVPLAKVFPLR